MHRYTDNYWKRVHLSLESSRYRIWKQATLALSKKRRERESQTLFCHDSALSVNSAAKDIQSSHGGQPYFSTTRHSGHLRDSQDTLSARVLLDTHSGGLSSLVEESVFHQEKDYLNNLHCQPVKEYRDRNCNVKSKVTVGTGSPTSGACNGALTVERRMNTNGRGAMTRSSTPTTSADNRPVAWGPPNTPPRPSPYSRPAQERTGVEPPGPLYGGSSNPFGPAPEQSPVQPRLYPGEPYPSALSTTTTPVFSPLPVYPYPQYPPHLPYPTSIIRRVQQEQQQQQQSLPHARPSYPFPIQQSNRSPPITPGLPTHSAYNLPTQHPAGGRSRSYIESHRVSPPLPPTVRDDRYLAPGGIPQPSHFKLDHPRNVVDLYGKSGPRSLEQPPHLGRRVPDKYLTKHSVKSEAPLPKIRHIAEPGGGGGGGGAGSASSHHHPPSYGGPALLPLTSTTSTSCVVTSAQSAISLHHHHQHQHHHPRVHYSQAQHLPLPQPHSLASSSHPPPSATAAAAAATATDHLTTVASVPTQPHYPPHFMKGSVIQLANGDLKRVEDLRTEDFVHSADISTDLKIDSSQVVHIEEMPDRGTAILGFSVGPQKIRVTVEATLEHPFFVFGQGWSSCSPDKTRQHYDLQCHKLVVGDICISLTQRQTLASSSSSIATTMATITTNGQHPASQSRPPEAGERYSLETPSSQHSRSSPQGSELRESQQPTTDSYRVAATTESGHISGNHGNSANPSALSGQQDVQGSFSGGDEATSGTGEYRTREVAMVVDSDSAETGSGNSQSRKRRWSAPEPISGTDEGPIDVTDSSSSSTNACTPEMTSMTPKSDQYSSTSIL